MAKARDYGREYKLTHSSPEAIADRSSRNKARRQMEAKHGKTAIKGLDVSHKNGNPKDNRASNLKLEKPSVNRARKK